MNNETVKKMKLSDEVSAYWDGQGDRLDELNEQFQKRIKQRNISEKMVDSQIESRKENADFDDSTISVGKRFLMRSIVVAERLFEDDNAIELKEQINTINENLDNRENLSDLDLVHSQDFKDWKQEQDSTYQNGIKEANGNTLNIDFGRYLGYSGAAVSAAGVAVGGIGVAGLAVGFASVAAVSTLIHKKNQNKITSLENNFEADHQELLNDIMEEVNDDPKLKDLNNSLLSNEQDLENELRMEIDGNSVKQDSNHDLSPDELGLLDELKSEVDDIKPIDNENARRRAAANRAKM